MWNYSLQIKVMEGELRGSIHPLNAPQVTIGRSPEPGLRRVGWVFLQDETVSSIQAELNWNDERKCYVLSNRSATNPTKVNEVEVAEEVDLKPGDQIRVGRTLLDLQEADLRFGGRPAAVEASPKAPASISLQPPTPPPVDRPTQELTPEPSRIALHRNRAQFQLEILEGTNAGQTIQVQGRTVALGGAVDPQEVVSPTWFDQQLALGDRTLAPRCVALAHRSENGSFDLAAALELKQSLQVVRVEDGLQWVATVHPGEGGVVMAGDQLQLGCHRIRLVLEAQPTTI